MRNFPLKIFTQSLAMILFLHLAAAQLSAQEAYKIDEIENPRCDLSEVPPIDPPPWGKFASALRDNPSLQGAIVVYGLEGFARRYAKDVRIRFNDFAGIAADRLVTIYGGRAKDSRLELWVIPQGAAAPELKLIEDIRHAKKFDSYLYDGGEICGSGRFPALAEFAEALKRRPEWQGRIVIRLHRNKRGVRAGDAGWDPDGYISRRQALRRVAQDKLHLVKRFGLSPARLKAVIGDNDEWTHTELWLMPPGVELTGSELQTLIKRR